MIDVPDEITTVHREVQGRGDSPTRTVAIRRDYPAAIDDVWDALTDPDRLRRWFLPVSGDLRLGGTYQLEGNAHGEILRCEPPRLLKVTWVFGDTTSEVEVRLSTDAAGTVFELEHVLPRDAHWDEFGPGAVGVGWDLTVLGLGLHLSGRSIGDPTAWMGTPEAREFMTLSAKAWGAAHQASGVNADEATGAMERTRGAYVPDQAPPAG